MGSDGFISVIVPARNAERYIKRTLESVLNQTHQDFEIVVVDNASTDTTAAIVTELAQRDPRIRLVRAQNIGVSAARNLAIKEARGELIAPVDADDVWHPEKLARQLAVMCAAGPNVGVVYCWSAGIDDDDRIILAVWTKSYAAGNVLHDIVVSGIVGNGSVPLLRRKYIDAVGGYDENLYLCEDWKFYTALAGACEFAVIPECLIGYRLRADSASMNVRPMDEAIEQVTAWIVQTWPKLPKGVLLDREYTVKAYLAFLAIRSGLYLDALGYLARAYYARPARLLGISPLQFFLLIASHLIGFRDFRWAFWRKRQSFWEVTLAEFTLAAALAPAPGIDPAERNADKRVQQQRV